jgi:hypothetical protein
MQQARVSERTATQEYENMENKESGLFQDAQKYATEGSGTAIVCRMAREACQVYKRVP